MPRRSTVVKQDKDADAILLADIHLRDDTPEAWVGGSYWDAQKTALEFIRDLQKGNNDCPILIAGDLFNKWQGYQGRCDYNLMRMFLSSGLERMHVIPGQHDLPNHNIDLIGKSAMGLVGCSMSMGDDLRVLEAGRQTGFNIHNLFFGNEPPPSLITLCAYPWGTPPHSYPGGMEEHLRHVALAHHLVYKGKEPFPGCNPDDHCTKFLDRMTGYDLILTGDNHDSFHIEKDGRLLVNPGSMLPMTANQADYQPRAWLYYAKDNAVETRDIPIPTNPISREHIDKQKAKDERMDKLVEALSASVHDEGTDEALSFENNLKKYLMQHETKGPIKDLLWEAVEEGSE